ncbi:MAG: YebC/PmpR family DNA-binding transcriptional regulator [Atopobiaceae bacterium]|jgi:YebC/PmpR family DNA-binding regulatory protein|nr:YebC/PmpR family DNA-binding transcriptional regulator [Atopobiaceae bacterium]MCI2173481.1 YebC/PmpR family DNA-binding transcriptional regulator [Atopobiaceae bacterium]MCI2207476.1 YebC/PmpR family DNA-binding transcriptional regulator [Atopobiaceae bacterium]
MSGHSKWATTKHKKAAIDAKRSSLFSKLSRNITVAAKMGGDPNPDNNATLASAVERARMVSMPNAKIKSAIDKAFGAGADNAVYENVTYEGYGPAGVAVYVACLTDNRNRTAADVRSAFTHAGGSLGTSGSVAFQFERKGSIAIDKVIHSDDKKVADKDNATDEDEFMMTVADAGGDDYEDTGDQWIVWTAYDNMQNVQKALEAAGIEVKGSELTMVPTTPTEVTPSDAKKVQRLVDRLEELEDVQDVYNTMDMTDEVVAALAEDE